MFPINWKKLFSLLYKNNSVGKQYQSLLEELQIFQKIARIDVILVSLAAVFVSWGRALRYETKKAAREANEIQEVKDRPDVF